MKYIHSFQRATGALCIGAVLAGCATPKGPNDQASESGPCDVAKTSATLGVGIALLTALAGGSAKDSAKNGLAAAAIGAAVCWVSNTQSKQTKTAEVSDRDYKSQHGVLPAEPKLVSYTSTLSNNTVQRGTPVVVHSEFELVNGSKQVVNSVREVLSVTDPEGNPLKTGSKPAQQTAAGRYANSFELKMPQNAPQGTYALQTSVYVNDKLVQTKNLQTQVVWDGGGYPLVQVASR